MIALTRRYRFSASHRLHVPAMSEAQNRTFFGKCNNPFGHGHDYVLSVTVAGKVDGLSGLLICTRELDRMVEEQVLRLFRHRNLNLDVAHFADIVPTTENLALAIGTLLENAWPAWFGNTSGAYRSTYLAKIHIAETDRNGFELRIAGRSNRPVPVKGRESVTVNG